MWDELDKRVRQRQPQPHTLNQLAQTLHAQWGTIPQQVIQTLIDFMGNRCQTVLDANGDHTLYRHNLDPYTVNVVVVGGHLSSVYSHTSGFYR